LEGMAGVGGVRLISPDRNLVPLALAYEGVPGVAGKESAEAVDEKVRFSARWTGRKIPEPGTEVRK